MPDQESTIYEYKWTGGTGVIVAGHTTPEGTGVKAEPGKKFRTIAPIDHPLAAPVSKSAKAAAKGEPVDEDPDDDENAETDPTDPPDGEERADPTSEETPVP